MAVTRARSASQPGTGADSSTPNPGKPFGTRSPLYHCWPHRLSTSGGNGEQVIDTVRDRDADGVGTEIVIIDAHGRAIPLHPVVLEVADQFSLLGIDADHGKPLAFKAGTQRGDVTKLLVAVRAGVGGNGLAIHAEGEIHVAKQSRYSIGRNLDIELPQQFSDSGRRLVGVQRMPVMGSPAVSCSSRI